ncbi:MAG TPA: hypothetical protein VH594_23080 [Trebonia sp.]
MRGERTGLVPAGSFDADVALKVQRDVGQQVAEDRQRSEGLAEHGRGLGGCQPGAVAGLSLDRVAPLVPAPLGQLEQQFFLAGVVAPYAGAVQPGALGDRRQRDVPDAAEF